METCFSTNFSFQLVATDFLSSGNSILLFSALMKFLKFPFLKRNLIPDFLISWTSVFAVESYFLPSGHVFLTNFSFRMVETNFLSCGNPFLSFIFFFYKWKPPLKLKETNCFGKNFISADRKRFSLQWILFSLILCSFPATGNRYCNKLKQVVCTFYTWLFPISK